MSVKGSLAANYASQAYVTLVGILVVPLYLKHLGPDAYGLVGFFTLLQALFNILDLGLSSTIARESARFRGGAIAAPDYARLYRVLGFVFACTSVIAGVSLFALSEVIAVAWLGSSALPRSEIVTAVQIMAISVALRWLGGLYRGVVSGAERLVWLSGFNAIIASFRFIGVLGSMALWGFTVQVFFMHQLAVAGLELIGLHRASSRVIPKVQWGTERLGSMLHTVRPMLKFSLTLALTSSMWIAITQTDKLLLSGILSLAEFGYFSSAVLMAGGITLITGPVSSVIMPRMARLHAQGDHAEVRRTYDRATQLVVVTAGSAAATMAWCAEPLMYAWTGSREIADNTAQTLRLYAIGNGLLALSAFPFYLQYARGTLRYHFVGTLIMGLALVPAILVAASNYGAVGAGGAWVAVNSLYLIFWVTFAHRQLEPGMHLRWLLRNVLSVILPALLLGAIFGLMPANPDDRVMSFLYSLGFGLACLAGATAGSSEARRSVASQIGRCHRVRD
jgi:O-antigen/teichoic acid export membrane protein